MGLFNITIQIANLNGDHFEDVEVMADTGAAMTIIPCPILDRLGITPTRRETFQYAGGEQVELDLAQANARVDGRETVTWSYSARKECPPCWAPTRWKGRSSPLIPTTSS